MPVYKKLKQYCPCQISHKTHESQATIQLQHIGIFYYPILTIASQSFDCDRYGNLHYYREKAVDIVKQSKERVNKLSNCHFFAPILKENFK